MSKRNKKYVTAVFAKLQFYKQCAPHAAKLPKYDLKSNSLQLNPI